MISLVDTSLPLSCSPSSSHFYFISFIRFTSMGLKQCVDIVERQNVNNSLSRQLDQTNNLVNCRIMNDVRKEAFVTVYCIRLQFFSQQALKVSAFIAFNAFWMFWNILKFQNKVAISNHRLLGAAENFLFIGLWTHKWFLHSCVGWA